MLSDLRDTGVYKKVRSRLKKVSRTQVMAWADSGVWSTQESLEMYARTQDYAALQQARTNVIGLLAAVDHLLDRPA
jgi:hypothetical protein